MMFGKAQPGGLLSLKADREAFGAILSDLHITLKRGVALGLNHNAVTTGAQVHGEGSEAIVITVNVDLGATGAGG
jgi:hypothetical protein